MEQNVTSQNHSSGGKSSIYKTLTHLGRVLPGDSGVHVRGRPCPGLPWWVVSDVRRVWLQLRPERYQFFRPLRTQFPNQFHRQCSEQLLSHPVRFDRLRHLYDVIFSLISSEDENTNLRLRRRLLCHTFSYLHKYTSSLFIYIHLFKSATFYYSFFNILDLTRIKQLTHIKKSVIHEWIKY